MTSVATLTKASMPSDVKGEIRRSEQENAFSWLLVQRLRSVVLPKPTFRSAILRKRTSDTVIVCPIVITTGRRNAPTGPSFFSVSGQKEIGL